MGAWNWIDWILAAVVLLSVVAAFKKGLVRELISLAAVVAGLAVAALGYQRAAVWFQDWTSSHQAALWAGFLTLFLGTLLVGLLISSLAGKLVKTAGLDWFDRFLGGIFGLLRGVLVDSVLLMAMVAFAIRTEAVSRSQLAPYITASARVIALAMPEDLKAQFRSGFDKFKEGLAQQRKTASR